jgi:hypothetical protein
MDSYGEFQRARAIIKRDTTGKKSVKAGIRVRGSYHGDWNKFGVSLDELISVLDGISSADRMDIAGIQFHTSWNLNPSRQVRMINEIGTFLKRHATASGIGDLRFMDMGGGFWPEQGEWLNADNMYLGRIIKDIFPSVRLETETFPTRCKRLDYFAGEISGMKGLDDYKWLRHVQSKGMIVEPTGPADLKAIYLNLKVKPFDDKRVRQAIAYGTSQQSIIDMQGAEISLAASSPVPSGHWGHVDAGWENTNEILKRPRNYWLRQVIPTEWISRS